MCEPCWQFLGRARHTEGQGCFSTRDCHLSLRRGVVHHTHLGIGSAGAQGEGAFCAGTCVMSAQKTREEGGRASDEIEVRAVWKSVLYLVGTVSGAMLTVEYFKLCCILKYPLENNRLDGQAHYHALPHHLPLASKLLRTLAAPTLCSRLVLLGPDRVAFGLPGLRRTLLLFFSFGCTRQ